MTAVDVAKMDCKQVLVIQLTILALSALFAVSIYNSNILGSCLIAGVVGILPSHAFRRIVLSGMTHNSTDVFIRRFYLGEMAKFGLICVLFVLALVGFKNLNPLVFLLIFVVLELTHWVYCLIKLRIGVL